MLKTTGIHHISSIVGHAQRNVDFYAAILGLRLVKKTLNFDDKSHYHFYFGNQDGSTGLVTTFPWNDAIEGRVGDGQVGISQYAIPTGSFSFWQEQLTKKQIKHFSYTRFGQNRLGFKDPDGLELEFVEKNYPTTHHWAFGEITADQAFIGIQSASLYSQKPEKTYQVLTELLGYEKVAEDEEYHQLQVNEQLGGTLELNKKLRSNGRTGMGAVHHIAFKVRTTEIEAWRQKIIAAGLRPTEVKNRKYFKSLYFREPGGILIELATEGPGVLVDETLENLGENLLIPPHFIGESAEIEATLMPVFVREVSQLGDYGYRDRYEFEVLQGKEQLKTKIAALRSKASTQPLTEAEQKMLTQFRTQLVKLK
ncbi:MAG: ring-cleaving dioxygenase [Enterococcus sp.]|nr:ring-cleaving dioxygenase [Enterococcus sp.]